MGWAVTGCSLGRTPLVAITGAASGIGLACAQKLAADWPTTQLVLMDRRVEGAMGLQEEYGRDRVLILVTDVSNGSDIVSSFDSAELWAGHGVTHLLACAGNHSKVSSLELTAKEWHEILSVHLDGTFFACQSAARQMMKNRSGSIVNFSSVAENFAWPARLPYAVAKAGISALTRTLAVEWSELGIRVNAVAPGYVNTAMVQNAEAAGLLTEDMRPYHALNRYAEPSEIAAAAIFLLSDAASFITGETLLVDGGFTAKKGNW